MNRDEILKLEAGAKMNQYIWWKVFDMNPTPLNNDMEKLPNYSDELSQAMEVVNKVHKMIAEDPVREFQMADGCNYLTLAFTGYDWAATFGTLYDDNEWYEPDGKWELVAHAKTVSLAICRAALLCVSSI